MPRELKKRKSSEPIEIDINELTEVKEIGEGGFGTVFHMIWKRENEDDLDVAAKRLFKVDRHELNILATLDHPNIVKLFGFVPKKINFMLILELCEGGSLRTYLRNHKANPLPPDLRKSWTIQAARAIEYLQEEQIIHKDVKSENYLIANGKTLKLADFGLAKLANKTLNQATERGTAAYMAPELHTEGSLSPTFDIFAYGVVVWEIITRDVPFEGKEHQVIVYAVCHDKKRLPIPQDCPEDLANLMRQCWLEDRNKRPSIKEILLVLTAENQMPLLNTAPQLCKDSPRNTANLDRWVLDQQITKLGLAQGIAISPMTGDIAITDFGGARLKVYNSKLKLNYVFNFNSKVHTTSPYAVAVSSDGTYFMTDQTNCVKVIDATCTDKEEFAFVLPDAGSPNATTDVMLAGLTIDNRGNLLVGCPVDKKGYIGTYTQDGFHLRTIKVNIRPQYLTVTPQGRIIVSSRDPEIVQIVDTAGQTLHTLNAPLGVKHWWPRGVCCSGDTIYVANAAGCDKGIYCYTACGEYMYLGRIISEVTNPMGLAVTTDGKALMVAERDEGVKIFKRRDLEIPKSNDSETPVSKDAKAPVSEDFNTPESEGFKSLESEVLETLESDDLETPESEDLDLPGSEDLEWLESL